MSFTSTFVSTITSWPRARFLAWIKKRSPASDTHVLNQKNLFIFPSKQGFIFVLIALVLWVLGTNYQNNLILALVFFMLAFLVVAILVTFSNLSQCRISYISHTEAFAGEVFKCQFSLDRAGNRRVDGLEFFWKDGDGARSDVYLEDNQRSHTFSLSILAEKRGPIALPLLGVQSTFPFGLVTCWTWLNIKANVLVYPQPIEGRLASFSIEDTDGDGLISVQGKDDFSGLKEYAAGDNIKHIAWKALARGQGIYTKDFSHSLSRETWLSFDQVTANHPEVKLSVLCHWILQSDRQGESYGLVLPSEKITPSSGYEHRKYCLTALAHFQRGNAL